MHRSQFDPARRMCGVIRESGKDCLGPVPEDSPLNICLEHMRVASVYVRQQVGGTFVSEPCTLCGETLAERTPTGHRCAFCQYVPGEPIEQPQLRAPSVVYYIRFGNRIKIGTSRSPRDRLASLPYDKLLAFELGDRALEQKRHEQFAKHRIGTTEWFTTHAALDRHIRVLSAGVEDPWQQYKFWVSRERSMHEAQAQPATT